MKIIVNQTNPASMHALKVLSEALLKKEMTPSKRIYIQLLYNAVAVIPLKEIIKNSSFGKWEVERVYFGDKDTAKWEIVNKVKIKTQPESSIRRYRGINPY